jgi:hypothetical protein
MSSSYEVREREKDQIMLNVIVLYVDVTIYWALRHVGFGQP